jgi:hypothetical protein
MLGNILQAKYRDLVYAPSGIWGDTIQIDQKSN